MKEKKVNDQNMDINQKILDCDGDIISVQIKKKTTLIIVLF